jgi:hypothetical protein
MTVRTHDAQNNKDWLLLCQHHQAMQLLLAVSRLTQRIARDHGTNVAFMAAAAAQQILNGKEPES